MSNELTEAAKHEDWMEKMEELIHQLEIMNQNLAGLALVGAAISNKMVEKPKAKKG